MLKIHPIAQLALIFGALFLMAYIGPCLADDVKVCSDRTTYPTKIVVVCNTCQCPAGYY